MRLPEPIPRRTKPLRRVGLGDALAGAFGAMVIGTTLFVVRVWAWLTRTPYHKD